jgi:hypothetical protein
LKAAHARRLFLWLHCHRDDFGCIAIGMIERWSINLQTVDPRVSLAVGQNGKDYESKRGAGRLKKTAPELLFDDLNDAARSRFDQDCATIHHCETAFSSIRPRFSFSP